MSRHAQRALGIHRLSREVREPRFLKPKGLANSSPGFAESWDCRDTTTDQRRRWLRNSTVRASATTFGVGNGFAYRVPGFPEPWARIRKPIGLQQRSSQSAHCASVRLNHDSLLLGATGVNFSCKRLSTEELPDWFSEALDAELQKFTDVRQPPNRPGDARGLGPTKTLI